MDSELVLMILWAGVLTLVGSYLGRRACAAKPTGLPPDQAWYPEWLLWLGISAAVVFVVAIMFVMVVNANEQQLSFMEGNLLGLAAGYVYTVFVAFVWVTPYHGRWR